MSTAIKAAAAALASEDKNQYFNLKYLDDMCELSQKPESMGNGLLLFSQKMHLSLIGVQKQKISTQEEVWRSKDMDAIYKRPVDDTDIITEAVQIEESLGRKFRQRNDTKITSEFTVYGRQQQIAIDNQQHSYFGLNAQYLDSRGIPSPEAIKQQLRNIFPTAEYRAPLINEAYNNLFLNNFYENYVSIGFCLYQLYAKSLCYDLIDQHNYTYVITDDESYQIRNRKGDDKIGYMRQILTEGERGSGIAQGSTYIEHIANELTRNTLQREFTVSVWLANEYNDGHTISQSVHNDVFGFINNRYIVRDAWRTVPIAANCFVQETRRIPQVSDLNNWSIRRYWLDLNGFTPVQKAILTKALRGNSRQFPLLLDQDIQSLIGNESVYIYNNTAHSTRQVFNTQDVLNTIQKFITNMQSHEDFLNARRTIRWWLAHPSNESVEAMQWTNVIRTQRLPELGMKRSIFLFLTKQPVVSITTDSIALISEITDQQFSMFIESCILNAAWYWGEFLLLHNQINQIKTAQIIRQNDFLGLQDQDRCIALVSSILGKAIPTCQFYDMNPQFPEGVDQIRNQQIRVQNPDNILTQYGYTLGADSIMFNQLVYPGGIAMLAGMDGPIIRSTPYSSRFEIQASFEKLVGEVYELSNTYQDLWALSVANRWHGYNTQYNIQDQPRSMSCYATNNVQIAMPPRSPSLLRRQETYELQGNVMRQNTFASEFRQDEVHKFILGWKKNKMLLHKMPNFTSQVAAKIRSSNIISNRVRQMEAITENYTLMVSTEYDVTVPDFRLSATLAGVSRMEESTLTRPPEDSKESGKISTD